MGRRELELAGVHLNNQGPCSALFHVMAQLLCVLLDRSLGEHSACHLQANSAGTLNLDPGLFNLEYNDCANERSCV